MAISRQRHCDILEEILNALNFHGFLSCPYLNKEGVCTLSLE